MKLPISEHIKSDVIYAWLKGESRDNIATEVNTGKGTVFNILKQWQKRIGVFYANNLRELGLALKKARLTPEQCAAGLITNIINQLGIDDDHLFDFLQKLYNESKKQRLLPADIAKLAKIIKDYPKINSLIDIPNYIKKRHQDKIKLDTDIYYKKQEIIKLDQEINNKRKEIRDLKEGFDSVRKEIRNESKEFLVFKNVQEELKAHDINIHVLDRLIDVIKIFEEMRFRPLTILAEFSSITEYRDFVNNKYKKIKDLEIQIQYLETVVNNFETKIASNEVIVHSLFRLENLGFNASDIKKLDISEKLGLDKDQIKIRFFKYYNGLSNLLTLEQDILEKTNNLSLLNSVISIQRKIIESQPAVYSILQKLINLGLNEYEIFMAFEIFKKDLTNNMPYGDGTYFERLSKNLDKYGTVSDTLQGLNKKILLKKTQINKLILSKNNLENILFSLAITIYFYSILLNVQFQIQKKLRIILIYNFNYLTLLCIVKKPNILNRSKLKIKRTRSNNNNNNNKKIRIKKRKKEEKDMTKKSKDKIKKSMIRNKLKNKKTKIL